MGYPMPSLSDIKLPKSPHADAALIVKNTFVNVLDFDSLQDFLKERKVKSCPASRQVSDATMLLKDLIGTDAGCIDSESDAKDEVLNTASSFGGVPHVVAVYTK